MMSEQHPGDLWVHVPEVEAQYPPGQVLDWWREAETFLAPLAELMDHIPNECLQTAVYSAHNRVSEQVKRCREDVWAILRENMKAGRLTPFGEVLTPILEDRGMTPKELLVLSGGVQKPDALEILLRHMYGPATTVKAGYLSGWDEALELTDEEASALTDALVWKEVS